MSVTPDFVGQRYRNTNNGDIWIANSTTPGDWSIDVRNMIVNWTGDFFMNEPFQIVSYFPIQDHTSTTYSGPISFGAEYLLQGFDIEASTFTSISFPNLVLVDPLLSSGFYCFNNPNLTSFSCPALLTLDDRIQVHDNPVLTTIDFSSFLPANGRNIQLQNNALSASSINHILARCVASVGYVSGGVILDGGTNAAPSGQGIADKATLIGRGVTVTTN